jgi:hypothetical protein
MPRSGSKSSGRLFGFCPAAFTVTVEGMTEMMRRPSSLAFVRLALLISISGAFAYPAATARADEEDRNYDFTDAFYLQNGVNPAGLVNRRTGTDGLSVFDTPFFASQRDVRVTLTLPAYSHSGNQFFWNVLGEFDATAFTNNAAGRAARTLAERSAIFVSPSRSGGPLVLGNNRQADMIDLRNGYFSNNPLGLWVIVFVNYTPSAFTAAGRQEVDRLAARNGRDLDGTAIIKNLSELEDFEKKGLVTRRTRPLDGSAGPRYSVCPVIEDPTDGGIAPDAFLAAVRRSDGTPVEPAFVRNFLSLQQTGVWAD